MKACVRWSTGVVDSTMDSDSRTVKQKVGTLLEAELVKEVRRVAAEEGKRMSDVFAEALVGYLAERRPDQQRAMRAYRVFCGVFRVSCG